MLIDGNGIIHDSPNYLPRREMRANIAAKQELAAGYYDFDGDDQFSDQQSVGNPEGSYTDKAYSLKIKDFSGANILMTLKESMTQSKSATQVA